MSLAETALRTLVPADATQRARLVAYRALPAGRRRRILARILRRQARVCGSSGSPLYEHLLTVAADDVEAGGPCWTVLSGNERPGTVLALRFMGAVHRVVLEGKAPELARFYPSVAADLLPGDPAAAFLAAVGANVEPLRVHIRQGVQTNEVSRCSILICGFLVVARETGLPLRMLEIGASAGMNLRWDRFYYQAGSASWGDPRSPVQLVDAYSGDCPILDVDARVAERRGCDLSPVDLSSEDTVLALRSLIWADQLERYRTFENAVELARQLPVAVDRASAPDWLAGQLEAPHEGTATIVYQSYVQQFLSAVAAKRIALTFAEAGRRATPAAPLAWLRLEPEPGRAALRLTTWPGGAERLVAASTPHGRNVRWLLDSE